MPDLNISPYLSLNEFDREFYDKIQKINEVTDIPNKGSIPCEETKNNINKKMNPILDRIYKINNCYNIFGKKNRLVNEIRTRFERWFRDNIDYECHTKINDEDAEMIIVNGEIMTKKKIILPYDIPLKRGNMIDAYGEKWIVMTVNAKQEIYTIAEIEQCTLLLRWQNPKTLEIIERWGMSQNPYSADIQYDKQVDSAANKIAVTIQLDDETKLLDMDKRFLMTERNENPVAYKIVGHDAVTANGLLVIKIQEDASLKDEESEIDNWDLMIANYIDPKITISIIDIQEVLIGSTTQLKYTIKNANGIVNKIPIFESSDENIATIDENGFITAIDEGNVIISVKYQNTIKSINIEVKPVVIDNFELKLTGVETLQIGRSSNYTGYVYNNGVITDEAIIWSINDLGINKIAILSNIDDNTCKITATSDTKLANKKFRVIGNNIDNGLSEYIEVTIKSLI